MISKTIKALKAEGYLVRSKADGFFEAVEGALPENYLGSFFSEEDAWECARRYRNWAVNIGQPGAHAELQARAVTGSQPYLRTREHEHMASRP